MVDDKYIPEHNFLTMTLMNIIWSVMGIVLGIWINNLSSTLIVKLNLTDTYNKIFFQVIICSFILSIIHIYVNNYFGWTWQNLTPGLFFVSFFFGVQFNIFNNIISLYNT